MRRLSTMSEYLANSQEMYLRNTLEKYFLGINLRNTDLKKILVGELCLAHIANHDLISGTICRLDAYLRELDITRRVSHFMSFFIEMIRKAFS